MPRRRAIITRRKLIAAVRFILLRATLNATRRTLLRIAARIRPRAQSSCKSPCFALLPFPPVSPPRMTRYHYAMDNFVFFPFYSVNFHLRVRRCAQGRSRSFRPSHLFHIPEIYPIRNKCILSTCTRDRRGASRYFVNRSVIAVYLLSIPLRVHAKGEESARSVTSRNFRDGGETSPFLLSQFRDGRWQVAAVLKSKSN